MKFISDTKGTGLLLPPRKTVRRTRHFAIHLRRRGGVSLPKASSRLSLRAREGSQDPRPPPGRGWAFRVATGNHPRSGLSRLAFWLR